MLDAFVAEFHAEMTARGVDFQQELALYTANKVGLAIEQVSNVAYRRCFAILLFESYQEVLTASKMPRRGNA
ncbi:MAG: hypothetical protein OXG88_09780 [Gammaproteobacteria bacterium]|nr:hypothetical protein [Gammaproteobacteria bacterium]